MENMKETNYEIIEAKPKAPPRNLIRISEIE